MTKSVAFFLEYLKKDRDCVKMVNEDELNDIKPESIADREKKGFYTIISEYNIFMIMKPDAIIYHDQEYKIIKSVRY
jgi:hypothetical protein